MGYIYTEQYIDIKCYKQELNQNLCDQFIQKWFSDIRNSSRGQFYTLYKTDFYFENYLSRLSFQNRCWITKLRTSNLRLLIEKGRWLFKVPRENRICKRCNTNIIIYSVVNINMLNTIGENIYQNIIKIIQTFIK